MGFFNRLLGNKESNNYTENLTNIILNEYWTTDSKQAEALADTLILNMGYVEGEKYILDAVDRYAQTTAKIFEAIEAIGKGEESTLLDIYYGLANYVVMEKVMMPRLIEQLDDLVALTFKWGDIKNVLKDEVKAHYPDLTDDLYDDMSEKLMEYLSFNIIVKNKEV